MNDIFNQIISSFKEILFKALFSDKQERLGKIVSANIMLNMAKNIISEINIIIKFSDSDKKTTESLKKHLSDNKEYLNKIMKGFEKYEIKNEVISKNILITINNSLHLLNKLNSHCDSILLNVNAPPFKKPISKNQKNISNATKLNVNALPFKKPISENQENISNASKLKVNALPFKPVSANRHPFARINKKEANRINSPFFKLTKGEGTQEKTKIIFKDGREIKLNENVHVGNKENIMKFVR